MNDGDEGAGRAAPRQAGGRPAQRGDAARRGRRGLRHVRRGAPVRDIAAKAGVGMGTIYRHFPTRADLIIAVYRHQVDACAEAGPALLATSATPHAALGAVDQPVRRLPGHQARTRRRAAVRQRRLRDAARLLPRPPRARVHPTARRRGRRRRDPLRPRGLRAHARRREPLHRRGQRSPTTTHAGWSSSSSRACATPRPILAGQSPRRATVRVRRWAVQIPLTCDRRPRDRSRHITANHRRRPSGRRRIL